MLKYVALGIALAASFFGGVAVSYYQLSPLRAVTFVKNTVHFDGKPSNNSGAVRPPQREGAVDVVMVGDSITARGPWQTLFADLRILNAGVDGDTALGVLNRINSIVEKEPRVAVLLIGVNDLLRDVSVDMVKERTELIVRILRTNSILPIVQSVLHVSADNIEINRRIGFLNDTLKLWCKKEEVAYLDLNSRLSPEGLLLRQYSLDGLHLNENGYVVWADLIRPHLERLGGRYQADGGK